MKVLVFVFVFTIGVNAIPINLTVEDETKLESPPQDVQWALMPDDEGNLHIVNLVQEEEPETFFNPETDIIFTLFTRANTNGVVIPLNGAAALAASTFNPNHPTRLTIHGWNGGGTGGMNAAIRNSFFAVGDFNMIVVDWGAGAQTGNNYLIARNRVSPTGVVVGSYINFLHTSGGMSYSSVSVIGFSLGGHVAGIAGKNTNELIATVIALDPAGPLFFMNQPTQRVDAGDAHYVEVMHTNAGLLGFDEPIGHASFYPNFGRTQPGCGIDITGNCAHGRAVSFYAESINSNSGFWARQCRDYNDILSANCVSAGPNRLMGGEPPNSQSRGVFWLQTNSASPFAMGPI